MQPILVTGFEPFGAHRTNPSEQVVRTLTARPGLVGAVLPVSYRRAEARLDALLEAMQPSALLLLGLAAGGVIRLERVARNLDQAEACDEDGELRCGRAVSDCGPPEHASTLPLEGFAAALARLSLPVAWSSDAGGFLCNHVFYRAREWLERRRLAIPCGFVHLPPLDALALERQLEGVAACLDVLAGCARSPRSGSPARSSAAARGRGRR
jgi:pyroglutamyl-peptidase